MKRLIEILQDRKKNDRATTECDNCHIRKRNSINKDNDVEAMQVDADVESASFWCVQCEKCLCKTCLGAHSQWGEFAEHEYVAIEEFAQNPKPVLSSVALKVKELEMCMHHGKPMDFYCKTCRCLICHYCTAKNHKDHDYEDKLTEIADEEREKVKNATAPLDKLLERVRNAVKELEDTKRQIDEEGEANIKKIRGTYDQVHKLLTQQEEEAVEKANAIKKSVKKKLAAQIANAKRFENDLKTCNELHTKIMEVDRTRLLLTYSDWVKNRVEELEREMNYINLDPAFTAMEITVMCPEPIEFIANLDSEAFDIPCLQNCRFSRYASTVKSRINELSKSSSFGNLLSLQSTAKVETKYQIKVTVMLRDRFGFPVTNQSDSLQIYCNNMEEDYIQDLVISEPSNGEYNFWYDPKTRENHSLHVYWNEYLVNNEEIKVLMTVRDYARVGQSAKTIDKYGPSDTQLKEPTLLAKLPNNEIIVYNHSTQQLVVFDEQLQYLHVIGKEGNGNKQFQCITGIAVDWNKNVYAVDCILQCIQKFKLSGEFISEVEVGSTTDDSIKSPLSIVVSQSEELFVCDSATHRIQVIRFGKFAYSFGQYGSEPGSFNHPHDLALNNSEDQLFIADRCNDQIQVFTPRGKFLKCFDMFPGVVFKIKSPVGIHYAPDGHLLVCCKDTNCVLVLQENGNFVHAIESKRGRRFGELCAVVVMDNGQIVVADKSNNQLLVFQ